jgi:hypothetical protein
MYTNFLLCFRVDSLAPDASNTFHVWELTGTRLAYDASNSFHRSTGILRCHGFMASRMVVYIWKRPPYKCLVAVKTISLDTIDLVR